MELNISIFKDELKSLIDDTRFTSSESKTAITALYGILGDKDNIKYNLITKYYEELSKYYKNLYTLLKNFIVEFIEVNNDEYKLKELDEQSSILQKRKNDAIEIIKYGILFAMIQSFYKFDESISRYYDLFQKIDVGYKEVDSNYNKQKSFLDNILSKSDIKKIGSNTKDIKNNYKLQKLYFLKFIYIFIKTYISLIKSGKEPLVSIVELEKLFNIIESFNVAYIKEENDADLPKLFTLIYYNIKFFYVDKQKNKLVNKDTNIVNIYSSISSVYILPGDTTAEEQLINKTKKAEELVEKQKIDNEIIKSESIKHIEVASKLQREAKETTTEAVKIATEATEAVKEAQIIAEKTKTEAERERERLKRERLAEKEAHNIAINAATEAVKEAQEIAKETERERERLERQEREIEKKRLALETEKQAHTERIELEQSEAIINHLLYNNILTIQIFNDITSHTNNQLQLMNNNTEIPKYLFKINNKDYSNKTFHLLNINEKYYYIYNTIDRNFHSVSLDNITIQGSTNNIDIIGINGEISNLSYIEKTIPILQYNYRTGGKNTDDDMKIKDIVYKIEKWKEPVYEAIILKEIMNIGDNEPETSEELKLTIKKPSIKISFKGSRLTDEMNFFDGIVKKLRDKKPITSLEMERFNNIENKIENIETTKTDKKQELLQYIKDTKKQLEEQNINIKDANIIDTTKILLDFKKVADIIKMILIGLTVICIIIYIVVLLISIYNLINLLIKVIVSIIYLFYNTAITNNDTLSYTTKRIIKCTKDNYSDDIFNVLNEQLTALSIFNTNLYIIYILLGYVILYLLYFIYTSVFSKYYLLIGTIKDIDPDFTLLTIIAIIFVCSFVHLLIYKFLFKSICLNKYKEINVYEESIDNQIKNILSTFDQDEEYNTKFYNLLTDTTKRSEIDTIFQNKVLELQDDTKNNLTQFLLIYNIYIYFEEFIYLSDVKKIYIKKYFDELNKGNIPSNSFISFLDINERKLIKPYHEDLPFYKQIPTDKIENYKKINDTIGDLLANINKSIIKYSGTFYPFLFTCIYIIIICIYNFICVYLILSFISGSKNEELFPAFIYKMADKFMDVSRIIYNLFNK
jgi:hypothetical protein